MKKFMKVCGITVLIMFLLGLILVTAGRLGGGRNTLENQILNNVFGFGSDILDWGSDWLWNEEWETYDLNINSIFNTDYSIIKSGDTSADYSGEDIHKLELSLGGCVMTLKESSDGDFHVSAERVQNFQTYTVGDTLYVNSVNSGRWSLSSLSTSVVIEIPAGVELESVQMALGGGKFTAGPLLIKELKLELGGGDFTFESLSVGELDCELGAGRLTIEELYAEKIDCDMGAGQIVVENAETTGNLSFEMGMGDLDFTGSIPGNLDAECAMGQMRFHILGSKEEDHNYDLECAAGSLRVGGSSFAGLASEKKIDNGADSRYRLQCSMGNLEVTFSD